VALVPLLTALVGWPPRQGRLVGQPLRRACALGLATGFVYFSGTVYWTGAVVSTFGGAPVAVGLLAMVLLSLYMALYPACFAMMVAWLVRRGGPAAIFLAPFVWVATEYARGVLFGGFPWVPLGNTQVTVLPVAQVASLVGVYGLSGLVAFTASALTYAVVTAERQRWLAIGGATAVLVIASAWGAWRIGEGSWTREGTPIRVGLVQANIAQADKWKASEARRIFTTHVAISRDVVRRGAEFVMWPESSTPFIFEEDEAGHASLVSLVRETGTPLLFGSEQLARSPTPHMYNTAFMLSPTGETVGVYHKIRLVPFGEYVPAKNWLSFVSPLVERFVDFAPGESVVMLPLGPHRISAAICYEVVYPWLAREAVLQGSELLTTITNDGWYGNSSAPFQHFEMAAMRAIEQGRYLARAANTGISGVVDPYGRVLARSAIFEQAGIVQEVRFISRRTVYSAIGDVVAHVSIALTVLALVVLRRPIQR
jgi:apolipoprotein N-acyltransferase